MKTPTKLSFKVTAKKFGATTSKRINDPGISSQSATHPIFTISEKGTKLHRQAFEFELGNI